MKIKERIQRFFRPKPPQSEESDASHGTSRSRNPVWRKSSSSRDPTHNIDEREFGPGSSSRPSMRNDFFSPLIRGLKKTFVRPERHASEHSFSEAAVQQGPIPSPSAIAPMNYEHLAKRLEAPAYRLEFASTMYNSMVYRLKPHEIIGREKVVVDRLGESMIEVTLADAHQITRDKYVKMKSSLLEEAGDRGLNLRRMAFDDDQSTIEMEHGIYEMNALFPTTMKKYFGQLANKPHTIVENKPGWMHEIAGPLSQPERIHEHNAEIYKHLHLQAASTPRPATRLQSGPLGSILTQVYGQNRGMVVGENHIDASPRRFLIENMEAMRSLGVTTLYLEHITETMQKNILDVYHRSPPGSPLPKDLELYLAVKDKNHALGGYAARKEQKSNATLNALVKAAQQHGVRVVAVETDQSQIESVVGPGSSSIPRMQTMNYVAMQKIIAQQQEKWVSLVGTAHMNTLYDKNASGLTGRFIPGVAELTGAVAVAICDSQNEEATLEHEHQIVGARDQMRWDHLLKLPDNFEDNMLVRTIGET